MTGGPDVEIPGENYTFSKLNWAQSLGDFEALREKGRRIIYVRLSSESDLGRLLEIMNAL